MWHLFSIKGPPCSTQNKKTQFLKIDVIRCLNFSHLRFCRIWLVGDCIVICSSLEALYDVYTENLAVTACEAIFIDSTLWNLETTSPETHSRISVLSVSKTTTVCFDAVSRGCRDYSCSTAAVHCYLCAEHYVTRRQLIKTPSCKKLLFCMITKIQCSLFDVSDQPLSSFSSGMTWTIWLPSAFW